MFLRRSFFLSVLFLISPTVLFAKTLRIGMGSPPSTFDWNAKTSMVDASVITNIQEGLFRNDKSGSVVPAIAEAVARSKDLKEYTFKIKKDAKWSDGRTVFAQDFVYSWLRLLSPQSTSIYSFYLNEIVNAVEFKKGAVPASDVGLNAVDDRTFKVKLKHANANWETITAFWPMFPTRKDQIEKFGNNWSRPGIMISTGPFVLESYEVGKKITLVRNSHYGMATNIDRIEITYSTDYDQLVDAYLKDQLDILLEVPHTHITKLEKRPDFQIKRIMQILYLGLNTSHFPMNSLKFRQALLKALDQDKLIPEGSHYPPAHNLIQKPEEGYEVNLIPKQDVAEAKKLLKDSAMIVGPKLKIKLLTFSREPYWAMAKLIQDQWIKKLGLNVEVAALDPGEVGTATSLGSYSAIVQGWTAKTRTVLDFLNPFSSENKQNYLRLNDKKYDQFLHKVSQSPLSKQKQPLIAAQRYLINDLAVYYPIAVDSNYLMVKPTINGFFEDHMGNMQLREASF